MQSVKNTNNNIDILNPNNIKKLDKNLYNIWYLPQIFDGKLWVNTINKNIQCYDDKNFIKQYE